MYTSLIIVTGRSFSLVPKKCYNITYGWGSGLVASEINQYMWSRKYVNAN